MGLLETWTRACQRAGAAPRRRSWPGALLPWEAAAPLDRSTICSSPWNDVKRPQRARDACCCHPTPPQFRNRAPAPAMGQRNPPWQPIRDAAQGADHNTGVHRTGPVKPHRDFPPKPEHQTRAGNNVTGQPVTDGPTVLVSALHGELSQPRRNSRSRLSTCAAGRRWRPVELVGNHKGFPQTHRPCVVLAMAGGGPLVVGAQHRSQVPWRWRAPAAARRGAAARGLPALAPVSLWRTNSRSAVPRRVAAHAPVVVKDRRQPGRTARAQRLCGRV